MSKANAANRDLDKIIASDKVDTSVKSNARALQDEISLLMERINSLKQIFMLIRSAEPQVLFAELSGGEDVRKQFDVCAGQFLSGHSVLIDVIHFLAKKLVEESCQHYVLFLPWCSQYPYRLTPCSKAQSRLRTIPPRPINPITTHHNSAIESSAVPWDLLRLFVTVCVRTYILLHTTYRYIQYY